MTLVELAVAIVVATIIMSMAMMIYTQTVKHSLTLQKRYFSVSDAAILKMRMDGALKQAEWINSANMGELSFRSKDRSEHRICLDKGRVAIDGESSAVGVKSLTFDLKSDSTKQVLLWNAVLGDSVWVGGAW